jgi:hypothetical protein
VTRRNRISMIGTPLVSRTLCVITALLLIAPAWSLCAIQSRVRSSRIWMEVYERPRAASYQGPPRREVVHVQLWPGGPGLRLIQERSIQLPRMDGQP